MSATRRTDCEGFHRRDFLTIGSAGMLGLTLPGILASEAKANARNVERQEQGQERHSGLAGRRPGDHRHVGQQARSPRGDPRRVQVDRHQGRRRADRRDVPEDGRRSRDKITIVRSLYHTIPSHGPATVFMTTGNKPTAALQYPSMGSLAAKLLKTEVGVPPYVTFGDIRNGTAGLAGYLGTGYNPFVIEGNGGGRVAKNGKGGGGGFSVRGLHAQGHLHARRSGEARHAAPQVRQRLRRPRQVQRPRRTGSTPSTSRRSKSSAATRRARRFDLNAEKQATRELYGNTPFGQGALAARRLVEAGVRFATVSLGGWDTHSKTFNAHKTRLAADHSTPSLSALIAGSRRSRAAGQHDRDVRRRVRPHAEDQQEHRPRPLGAVDGLRARRRRLQARLRPRHHRRLAAWPRPPTRSRRTTSPARSSTTSASTRTPNCKRPTGRPIQLFREGKVIEKAIM